MKLENQLKNSLYLPEFEKENCGFGMILNLKQIASHQLLKNSIKALARLSHRGARSADEKSGDGCGLLFDCPQDFFKIVAEENGIKLKDTFAVGNVFLSHDPKEEEIAKNTLSEVLKALELSISGWRIVPIDKACLGEQAASCLPKIQQVFIDKPDKISADEFERLLYVARKRCEEALADDDAFYIVSLSAKTIGYKGLVTPENLSHFYLDLRDERLEIKLCLFHQRFSTNTLPQWRLAQPFRFLAHNGEINTIKGNRNWANAKNERLCSDKLLPYAESIMPVVSHKDSDSCSLDNVMELLYLNGMSLPHVMRILIPPAWQNTEHMDPDLKAFYEFNAMHMGAWDGPAGVVTTDGRFGVCALDRNGLRPARWVKTKDGHIILASEVGVYDYEAKDVLEKGRLGPGEILVIDTETGDIIDNTAVGESLKSRKPYKKWLQKNRQHIARKWSEDSVVTPQYDKPMLSIYQKTFGMSYEEQEIVIKHLAKSGVEATGSMGDDTPMAVLSEKERSLYDYFRQQFAQVTNPPIDPIREKVVMSLKTYIGKLGNIFDENESLSKRMVLDTPIIMEPEFERILGLDPEHYPICEISLNYPTATSLQDALRDIIDRSFNAVEAGIVILILNDEYISESTYPVHALLATGAIHHALTNANLRCYANIIVKTGTARDSHHMATLLGYGATAIYPYLSYQMIAHMAVVDKVFKSKLPQDAIRYYVRGLRKGLYKIMSKMGISSMTSYRGAQLFETIGLADEIVKLCFFGTVNRLKGASFNVLHQEQISLVKKAWKVQTPVDHGGRYKFVFGGEYHAFNPEVVMQLQLAVTSGRYEDYCQYRDLVNNRPIAMLRDMLKLEPQASVELSDVESIDAIIQRFDGAGMSLGALSPEAHEAIAIAMNRLGGRSNSGEGGEDRSRYGTERRSKIKQIASGRFGVTPEYLMSAEVIQIKISQGAKPGEGGQLPGHKVTELIAKLRYATVGVPLISPPPHHDIYSIEDLAQLIYDLKQVNPAALISVKLVSEAGVGTIAAGVAKAFADLITISGNDGGTGASPLTSIVYAGSPWEIGLSETQQILCANGLRSRIRVQVDGGLKTGLDVIKGAILGAESFGFGTAPMIALGCKYLRICHLNNCATGVATQDEVLREKHFHGTVEKLMCYFQFVAQDVREIMASLGVTRLVDLIGRVDLLKAIEGQTEKQKSLDLSPILAPLSVPEGTKPYCTQLYNKPFGSQILSDQIFMETKDAIARKQGGIFHYKISNIDRSIGAGLSGEIAKKHGDQGMSEAPIVLNFKGSAGQSFGVFNAGGLHLILEGDANDYVGKGMAGGRIMIKASKEASFIAKDASIIGNTCLYGATGGLLYAAGKAGERFAVRNSGAVAVIEGAGDHCCEYMTGGVVLVLGQTGINFGAGMTGGIAYVLDTENKFVDRYNHELINIHRVQTEQMTIHRAAIYNMLEDYILHTQSLWAKEILDDFEDYISQFWLVMPIHESEEREFENVSEIA